MPCPDGRILMSRAEREQTLIVGVPPSDGSRCDCAASARRELHMRHGMTTRIVLGLTSCATSGDPSPDQQELKPRSNRGGRISSPLFLGFLVGRGLRSAPESPTGLYNNYTAAKGLAAPPTGHRGKARMTSDVGCRSRMVLGLTSCAKSGGLSSDRPVRRQVTCASGSGTRGTGAQAEVEPRRSDPHRAAEATQKKQLEPQMTQMNADDGE